MYDNDFEKPTYSYHKSEPIVEIEAGSYADLSGQEYHSITWNHGLAEVITALLENGLTIQAFQEYDYSPYNCFNHAVEVSPGKFQISKMKGLIPLIYSVEARKSG
jgi:hypothetical protein